MLLVVWTRMGKSPFNVVMLEDEIRSAFEPTLDVFLTVIRLLFPSKMMVVRPDRMIDVASISVADSKGVVMEVVALRVVAVTARLDKFVTMPLIKSLMGAPAVSISCFPPTCRAVEIPVPIIPLRIAFPRLKAVPVLFDATFEKLFRYGDA